MKTLPTCIVYQISEETTGINWMIEDLWLDNGVGLLGGEPKSFKTFAALSLAVAVRLAEVQPKRQTRCRPL